MSFYNELEKLFNIDEIQSNFSIYMLGSNVLAVEGYTKILSFTSTEVSLKLKGNEVIVILGAKLQIKSLEKQNIVICGDILCVKRGDC